MSLSYDVCDFFIENKLSIITINQVIVNNDLNYHKQEPRGLTIFG